MQHCCHTHQHISTTYDIFVFLSFGPSMLKPYGTKFHQSLPSNWHDCPFDSDIEVFLSLWHFKVHLQIVTHHYNNFFGVKIIIEILLYDMAFLKCLLCQNVARIQYLIGHHMVPTWLFRIYLSVDFFQMLQRPNHYKSLSIVGVFLWH